MIATNAAGQAILASRNMAAQVIAIRKYYTDNVVDKVVRMLHGELRGDQISVQTELANALPKVDEFDRTPGSGAANKLRGVRPSGVRIEVVDSGTGIPQKSIDRVFDHFYTTKTHGMGVRLSICRSIVENHGGQLAASRLDTYGTIFLPPRLRIDCG